MISIAKKELQEIIEMYQIKNSIADYDWLK